MPNESPQNEGPDPNQAHRDIARWTKAVALFTFFLVFVSAIADWFIYQQYRVANDAQADTREQYRAVVTQFGGQQIVVPDPDGRIARILYLANFMNTGGTRTAWFHGWISAHYFEGATPPGNLDLTKPYQPIDTPDTVIGANAFSALGPVAIPREDAQKLLLGQGVGLVWGEAQYADIYEPAIAHTIGFCMLVTAAPNPLGGPSRQTEMTPYRPDCNKRH